MNRATVTAFLHYLRAHDPYLEVDPAIVQAWTDALDDGITSDFARQHCIRHYRQADAPRLTPAVINAAWSSRKRHRTLSEIESAAQVAVPMPQWFRERIRSGGVA